MKSFLLLLCFGGMAIFLTLPEVMGHGAVKSGSNTLNFTPKFSKLLDADTFGQMKQSPSLGVILLYKGSVNVPEDFLNQYDKAAGFLNAYGIPLGVVDCTASSSGDLREQCSLASGDIVNTYRNGQFLMDLDIMSLFDVDSIMANILFLVLVDDVAIVQTKSSRLKLEHDNAGQRDVVLAYQSSIGTYENRVFMEIAYAYQDKYKFAFTSQVPTTSGLQDWRWLEEDSEERPTSMLWVLYCRNNYTLQDGCFNLNYPGNPNLIDLALFFKRLEWPRLTYKKVGSTETHPCESDPESGCVIISHSPSAQKEADEIIHLLQFEIHGHAGLVVEPVQTDEKVLKVVLQKPGGESVTLEGKITLYHIISSVISHFLPNVGRDAPKDCEEGRSDPTTIDDMVINVAFNERRTIADVPHLPALTDKTFYPTTGENNKKLVMVLYYLPFNAEGMVFLKPFEEAGKRLAALKGDNPSDHPLFRVNCFDWQDVCQKEKVVTYPSIVIYTKGGKREEYRQALDTDVIVRTVMLLQAEQPLVLTREKEVVQFLGGQLPTTDYQDVENLVLLKLSASRKEKDMYMEVVKALESQMLFALVAPDTTDLVPNGGVLLKRTKDPIQPMDIMTDPKDAASIVDFLRMRQFNVFPELTFLNFPALYARNQPFGILFFEPSVPRANQLQQTLISHVLSGEGSNMILCKMTMGDSNPEAKFLLRNYTQAEDVPAFTIVNHKKGHVYVLQDKEMTGSALLPWIQAVEKGEVAPTKLLDQGEWKATGQFYDFLALIDMEKEKALKKASSSHNAKKDELNTAEQQQDADARSALLELQNSRLYSIKDRKAKPAKKAPEHSEL